MINRVLTLYPDETGAFLNDGQPTLEVLGGIDSINIAVAATDEVPDIADDSPQSALAVDTDAVSGEPYLAMELSRRVAVDTAILMGINARDTYPGDVRNNFTLKHHTSDVYGSATAIVPNSAYARIIGEAAAFTRYNGLNSYTSIADDPNLKFGANRDFSIGVTINTIASTSSTILVTKGSSAGANNPRYGVSIGADGTIVPSIAYVSDQAQLNGATSVNDGEYHRALATYDRDGNLTLYIDGVSDGTPVDISTIGDTNSAHPLAFGIRSDDLSSVPFDGDIKEVVIYNRVLSAEEALDEFNNPELYPLVADQQGGKAGDNWQQGTFLSTVFTAGFPNGDQVADNDLDTCYSAVTWRTGDTINVSFVGSTDAAASFAFRVASNTALTADVQSFAISLGLNEITITGAATDLYVGLFRGDSAGGSKTARITEYDCWIEGAVAVYQPEGISDKWYDRLSKNLDGTFNNVEKIGAATGGLKDILVMKFDEIMSANLYMDLNTDGLTGTDDLEVSDWLQAKSFTTGNRNIGRGSYRSPESFPGVTSKDTRGGDSQSSVLYGRRNPFSWTYVGLNDSQVARLKEIYRIQEGTSRLMVLGVQENDGDEIPYPVKFDGPMTFVRKGKLTSVGIKLMEQATT